MATGSGRPRPSLRRRLALGITLAAALAALLEALLLHLVWYDFEEQLIHDIVIAELQRSVEINRSVPGFTFPNSGRLGLYVAGIEPDGSRARLPEHLRPILDRARAIEQSLDGSAEKPGQVLHARATDGITYHVGIARDGDQIYVLAYDGSEHDARYRALLAARIIVVLLLTLVAYRVAGATADRLLAGLSGLRAAVASGPGEAGFEQPGMDAEVAELAAALDEQRGVVAAALRKERAFAAAASHELRTPLTRIATATDVLRARKSLPEAAAARLRSIRESADELQRLLDVLLTVARWQPGERGPASMPATQPPRALGELVDDCVARLAPEARMLGTTIDVAIGTPHRAVPHAAMLEVVLANLVRNAIRHGRGAPVLVREAGGALEVRDAGPGIDAVALGRVFDPFWRGVATGGPERSPPGQGLGMTIAERLCAAAGWTLSIDSGAGRGTCVRVDLGAVPA